MHRKRISHVVIREKEFRSEHLVGTMDEWAQVKLRRFSEVAALTHTQDIECGVVDD
jgi:hypothetical protein